MNSGDKAEFSSVGQVNPDYFVCEPGLSKRELFAATALQGILAKGDCIYYRAAKMAVDAADALIAELEKPRQE